MRIRAFAVAAMLAGAIGPLARAAPPADVEQGANLFAITCSSSFCHGAGGVGARGPSLRNRDFAPDFVRDTLLQGRSGTPMPAFKDTLSPAELTAIVAYVMSLSPNDPAAGGMAEPAAPAPSAQPLTAQARMGAEIFFDIAKPNGCSLCHSYRSMGGPIGPDLSAIAGKTPTAIYRAIIAPPAADPAYPAIAVTTQDGRRIVGIQQERTGDAVRIYDLSSVPPVLRSFYDSDGARIEKLENAPYRHDLTALSKDEIASLIAFLKSADGAPPKDVSVQDINAGNDR